MFSRQKHRKRTGALDIRPERMCSLQNVFSIERVKTCSLQTVFSIECVLYTYLTLSRQKKPRKEIPVPQIHERTKRVTACTVISPWFSIDLFSLDQIQFSLENQKNDGMHVHFAQVQHRFSLVSIEFSLAQFSVGNMKGTACTILSPWFGTNQSGLFRAQCCALGAQTSQNETNYTQLTKLY